MKGTKGETDLLLLNTPSPSKLKQKNRSHPASRKLQDQFEGKKAPEEDVDRLLLSTSPIVTKDKSRNNDDLHFDESGDTSDTWVEQIQNYTEIEDTSCLSQDSVDSWPRPSHQDTEIYSADLTEVIHNILILLAWCGRNDLTKVEKRGDIGIIDIYLGGLLEDNMATNDQVVQLVQQFMYFTIMIAFFFLKF
ncbi:hypothetical protein LOTGIDRAFT_164860 [Lottia gigantea]|uniref:Uncharacterized protein n=1 Tax=Lottia gigantea TaxID=225164 RepID=V4BLW2_LOTGI|nr:hypothetical protein LOTGIDRAFT_164860 [Lottia gigantea]ESO89824.1 hypothetical protein LOTGIDRAFT_164860 [Lottia gigantea]